jgi:hypothetical protein
LACTEAEAPGLVNSVDFAADTCMPLSGAERSLPRSILDSHLESVPHGGNHDGAAGVLCSMAGIRSAMVFVRVQTGSNTPPEAMRMRDFAAATAIVTHWAPQAATQ